MFFLHCALILLIHIHFHYQKMGNIVVIVSITTSSCPSFKVRCVYTKGVLMYNVVYTCFTLKFDTILVTNLHFVKLCCLLVVIDFIAVSTRFEPSRNPALWLASRVDSDVPIGLISVVILPWIRNSASDSTAISSHAFSRQPAHLVLTSVFD